MSRVAHLRGRIAGAAILTFFGGLWCVLALANWPRRPRWSIPAGVVLTVALLVLCVARLASFRNMPGAEDPHAAAKGKRAGVLFAIIFGIEGGLIAICSALLASNGLGIWIPFALAMIVGSHFLPLARVFEVPLYYGTGALCTLGALGCLLIHDSRTRALCVGLVMASVLWLSVVTLLLQTHPKNSTPS